jgi:DNA-binding response OmpR family regulator
MPAARRSRTQLEEGGLIEGREQGGTDMDRSNVIGLFIDDAPVLSSLQFSLATEGLTTIEGDRASSGIPAEGLLVIDQSYQDDGLRFLAELRERGCAALAIILVTNPNPLFRTRAGALGAHIIEKPLLGDELRDAISALLGQQKAA